MIDAVEIVYEGVALTVDFSCNSVQIISGNQDITAIVDEYMVAEITRIAGQKLREINAV